MSYHSSRRDNFVEECKERNIGAQYPPQLGIHWRSSSWTRYCCLLCKDFVVVLTLNMVGKVNDRLLSLTLELEEINPSVSWVVINYQQAIFLPTDTIMEGGPKRSTWGSSKHLMADIMLLALWSIPCIFSSTQTLQTQSLQKETFSFSQRMWPPLWKLCKVILL
jgi:hypothetical protein